MRLQVSNSLTLVRQVMSGSYNGDFYICDAFQPGNITQLTLKANDSTWGQFDTSNKVMSHLIKLLILF